MKYFRSYVSAQFSSVSVVRMFGNNNVNGGTRQTNLVVKLILCLIVPAYHTLQAELGKRSKLNITSFSVRAFKPSLDFISIKPTDTSLSLYRFYSTLV